jgi:hypothetical protein
VVCFKVNVTCTFTVLHFFALPTLYGTATQPTPPLSVITIKLQAAEIFLKK